MLDGIIPHSMMQKCAESFAGVPHRATPYRSHSGILCIESSIDSTPTRVAATLSALPKDARIRLLLGGKGKSLSYLPLIAAIDGRIAAVYTFGALGLSYKEAVLRAYPALPCRRFPKMEEATRAALADAEPSDTILLSPGGTSYDEYADYTARGAHFCAIIAES